MSPVGRTFLHDNTVDRAAGDAEFAARAFLSNDGMHEAWCSKDGINGASFETQGATDASGFLNESDSRFLLNAMAGVWWQSLSAEKIRQRLDQGFTARRALIDFGLM